MCSACTDSPKFTMKLTEIYRYMATHDSHSKFWTCDSEFTAFSSCRTSLFLLKNKPRVNASKYGCTQRFVLF